MITLEEKEEAREDQEHKVFNHLMKRAKEINEKQWEKNTTNISKKVYPEKKLELKQRKKTSIDLKIFSEKYRLIILFNLQLLNGPTHSKNITDVKNVISNGYNDLASIKWP